jgi:hypothetical protein
MEAAHREMAFSHSETYMTLSAGVPTIDHVKRQVELTKRRAVDLCRVATCLCPML